MKKPFFLFAFVLFCFYTQSQNYDIYVSDAGNFNNPPWQILKFEADGSNPQVFINTNLSWPQDILFIEDQNVVLVSNLNTNKITRYDAGTGQYINDFGTGISGPTRMKIGPDSLLYVLQWTGNGKVMRYNLTGSFIDEFTSTGVNNSIGLDWDNDGNLYVSSYSDNLIQKFDTTGNDLGAFVNTGLNGPVNIWFDNNQDMNVIEWNAGNIKKFNSNGVLVSTLITGLSQPEGIAFLPSGNLLIGNGGTASVHEYTPGGTLIGNVIPSGAGNLIQPNAVVLRFTGGTSVTELQQDEVIIKSFEEAIIIESDNMLINKIKIYNVLGLLIEERINCGKCILNVEHFTPGIYFLNIAMKDGKNICRKVIIN